MSKVSYIEIPPGLEDLYKKGLQPGDRFTFSRIRIKDIFLSRSRKKGVTQKSLLVELAPVWAGFSDEEKTAWNTAGAINKLSGFKMFIQDTAQRRRAGFSDFATPNDTYQGNVGRIEVQAPATGLTIEQAHPLTYYVYHKVAGTRSQYSPVAVTESFGLPLHIEISYKSDLTGLDGDARARFFCVVYSSYQGRTIETPVEINFSLSHDWETLSAEVSGVLGLVRSYSAFIEVYNARGTLYFDNVVIRHNSVNWARDPFCNNVSQSFTKAFFQIPKHWAPVDISDGSDFGSFYFSG